MILSACSPLMRGRVNPQENMSSQHTAGTTVHAACSESSKGCEWSKGDCLLSDFCSHKAMNRKCSALSLQDQYWLPFHPCPCLPAAGNGSPMQLHSFVFSEFKINYFNLFSGTFEAKVIFRRNNFFLVRCSSYCSSGTWEKNERHFESSESQILMFS